VELQLRAIAGALVFLLFEIALLLALARNDVARLLLGHPERSEAISSIIVLWMFFSAVTDIPQSFEWLP